MTVATLRQALKNYLSSRLRIDQWGVGLPANISDPRKPPSIALDEPGKFEESGFFQGQGSPTPVTVAATLPFQILYRFHSTYKYDQLPRGEFEAKLIELRSVLRQSVGCELDDVLPGSFKTSSSVAVAQQENKDWLLVCKLTIICELQCEAQDIQMNSGLFSADGSVASISTPLTRTIWASIVLTVGSAGQTIFTLPRSFPFPQLSELYLEGEKMAYGRDYTIVGTTLTWLSVIRLDPTDFIELFFIVTASSQIEVSEVLVVTSIGQTTFVLSQSTLYPSLSEFFIEGEKLAYGRDYTIVGTTLTWLSIIRLEPSDFLEIAYTP